MFYTYIIYSKTLSKYYVGSCQNIQNLLDDHLNSRSKFTKSAKDWELKYSEEFSSRSGSEANQREIQIKKMKSRVYIEKLIANKN